MENYQARNAPSATEVTNLDKYSLKRSLLLLAGALILSVGVGTYANAIRPKTLFVTIDERKQELYTAANTVEAVFDEMGFDEADTAIMNVEVEDGVEENMEIVVTTEKDIVYSYAGVTKNIKTYANDVESLLQEQGAVIDEWDVITPPHGTKLNDWDIVTVDKIEVNTDVEKIELPFESKTENTSSLYKDQTKVSQEGKVGTREIETQTTVKNGEVIETKTVRDEVTVEPVDKITLKGTKVRPTVTKSGVQLTNVKRKMTLEATAYTFSRIKAENTTKSGLPVGVGKVAVDPRVIPLGTKLYIEGYGHAIAADTGGAIKGHRIDLFFNTNSQVYNFGRRNVTVYVLGK